MYRMALLKLKIERRVFGNWTSSVSFWSFILKKEPQKDQNFVMFWNGYYLNQLNDSTNKRIFLLEIKDFFDGYSEKKNKKRSLVNFQN